MHRLTNLTPHTINIKTLEGRMLEIPPSGAVARCAEKRDPHSVILEPSGSHIQVRTVSFGAVENLPPPQPHVLYIVSILVKQASPNRADLVTPGILIRDEKGAVVGCDGLTA